MSRPRASAISPRCSRRTSIRPGSWASSRCSPPWPSCSTKSCGGPRCISAAGTPIEGEWSMAGKVKLTVACGDYEIVRALKEGAVEADGLDLVMLTDMGPRERHWRMARKAEFDVCEANVGAYFMERDQGAPLTAIPVFLHRRFRHGFLFVSAAAGIRAPKELIGKKVGGTNFQPASNIWMRGILEEEYALPHRQVTWVVERSEDVPFTPPKDLRIEMIAPAKRLDVMLAEGEIPAM